MRAAFAQGDEVGHGGKVYCVGAQPIVADDDDPFNIRFGGQGCWAGRECRFWREGGRDAGDEGGGGFGCRRER